MREFAAAIEAVVKEHPLSQQVLEFLIEHEAAMDTVDGVATCWVNSDPVAVKSVLDSLQSAGVVATEVLSCGTYYRLTANAEIRMWLKTRYAQTGAAQHVLASAKERQPGKY